MSVVSHSRRDEKQFTCALCRRVHAWSVSAGQFTESPVVQLDCGHCVHMRCVAEECQGQVIAMQIGFGVIGVKDKKNGDTKKTLLKKSYGRAYNVIERSGDEFFKFKCSVGRCGKQFICGTKDALQQLSATTT